MSAICEEADQEIVFREKVENLRKAGSDLIEIVEGITGAMEYGTFRGDMTGRRLSDTREWVRLYNAVKILGEP